MKRHAAILLVFLLITISISTSGFAEDVIIDSSGNVTTGVSTSDGNLEVTGSDEDGIVSTTTGTGKAGVYGGHSSGNYGVLGDDQYGVYGESSTGEAGHFQGDARVTGDLTVDGVLNATVGDTDTVDGKHAIEFLSIKTYDIDEDGKVNSAVVADTAVSAETASDSHTVDGKHASALLDKATYDTDGDGKVNSAASTDDSDMVDGMHASDFAAVFHTHSGSLYSKVAVVAQAGGDYTSPLDAMTDLASWCGTPSSTNPCLVKIMPGVYDIGFNTLMMQPLVDIEGSGEHTTVITSNYSSSIEGMGTVKGVNYAELRFLTVENRGGGQFSIAMYNENASPDISNVSFIASGGSNNQGIYNYMSSPKMRNVTIKATGGTYTRGIYNQSCYSVMNNVSIKASGGSSDNYGIVNASMSSPLLNNVSINGIIANGNTLFVPAADSDTHNGTLLLSVRNELDGLGTPSETNRYTLKLDAGTYDLGNNAFSMKSYVDIEGSGWNTTVISSSHSDSTYFAYSGTINGADNSEIRGMTVMNTGGSAFSIGFYNVGKSPDIKDVNIAVSGGYSYTLGIYNSTASPNVTDSTVVVSGGSTSSAVYNVTTSNPVLTDVTATASGGYNTWGIYNSGSYPDLTNVTVKASGGTYNRGVYNKDGATPTIRNSSIAGSTSSIYNYTGTAAMVATTMLNGPVSGTGFYCAGVYNVLFTPLSSTCN